MVMGHRTLKTAAEAEDTIILEPLVTAQRSAIILFNVNLIRVCVVV